VWLLAGFGKLYGSAVTPGSIGVVHELTLTALLVPVVACRHRHGQLVLTLGDRMQRCRVLAWLHVTSRSVAPMNDVVLVCRQRAWLTVWPDPARQRDYAPGFSEAGKPALPV